jgi:hypothetical protein
MTTALHYTTTRPWIREYTVSITPDSNLDLKLWEDDYRTIAGKLICNHGFKGRTAIRAIKGGCMWEGFPMTFRKSFLRSLTKLRVSHSVISIKKGTSVLILGRDRVVIAAGIKELRRKKVITVGQRADFILRLSKDEFPNPDDEFEVAIEFDLIVSS